MFDILWLKEQIEAMEFPCALSTFAAKNKPCLVIPLGHGIDNKEQLLQAWIDPQTEEFDIDRESDPEPMSILHLFMPICICENAQLGEMASLILLANAGLEVPGFGYSPSDKYVYYHSTTFLSSSRNADIVKSMMGLAMLYVDGFSQVIHEIASGKKTRDEALKDLINSAGLK